MHLKETLLFIILVYTSYLFLLKFSKDENEELITGLQVQNHVECPTGITLYRLKSGSFLYRVQVQSKLPHDPAVTFKILKRCETFQLDERGQGNERVVDKSAARHSPVEAEDYEKIGLSLSYLVDEACKKQDYTTQECGMTSNGSGLVSRITASYPFMAYLLEVVKGPDTSKMIATANVTTEWSYQTLIRGIFPGTLWCGFGNIADDTFGQLGDNAGADECCRLHDLCKPIIKAFQTRYHFSNPSVVPISHCGCDMQFYNCLRRVNSQASNTIGKIFFNIAKMKCFDFDMRNICTSSFLGFCTEYSSKCVAILKNNKNYPS